ncbi:MAG: UDPGP type 1 family protein [Planctomycetia bacterium]|nr:UDPGP type 1 family protein [Planctomycetia bacterium]
MTDAAAVVPAPLASALARAGQERVLRFWPTLDAAGRSRLLGQLAVIDWDEFETLQRLASRRQPAPPAAIDLAAATTPPCLRLRDPANAPGPAVAVATGERLLAAGRVGAILVAGGQGTRLGCHGPKGLVAAGPVSGANLFELLFGKLRAVHRRFGRRVPLAIMTSSATDAATRRFLGESGHCGLDPDFVHVFRQHDLPAIDAATGAILLDAPDRLALAPDGHGGMLVALHESGGLDWFGRHGVEHLASFQVDNPLALPLDREFLGYHALSRADFSTQVVSKREPGERVGVVVEQGGRHAVVEYSDLPPALAAERRPDGRLRFHAGSIAVHCFTKAFLDRAAARRDSLPLHLAHKAVPYLDELGTLVRPATPNAFKFERFIFDLMPLARSVTVVEIDACDGFAPLKNPAGSAADAPEHVHAALVDHARRLLAEAGVTVADGVDVELDSATILDAADVAAALPRGTHIATPQVIRGMIPRT